MWRILLISFRASKAPGRRYEARLMVGYITAAHYFIAGCVSHCTGSRQSTKNGKNSRSPWPSSCFVFVIFFAFFVFFVTAVGTFHRISECRRG
jgi:hypothetical protein